MEPSKFSKEISPLSLEILDLPPSCIEFIPGCHDFFVVGTYYLHSEIDTGSLPQSRTGSLNLLRIVGERKITLIQTLSHPSAVLDLHFVPHSFHFGVASSTGAFSIYRFELGAQRIAHIVTHQVFVPSLLITSFTWHPSTSLQAEPALAATLSDGSIHLIQLSTTLDQLLDTSNANPINMHTEQAWTCAYSTSQMSKGLKIYSGGDDSMLRLVELSVAIPSSDPIKREFKGHGAGVTAILPLPVPGARHDGGILDDLLLTGSYDDYVRIYHASTSSGKALAELKIGGGVWRLKFLDRIPPSPSSHGNSGQVTFRILASCMHAGARILRVAREEKEPSWTIEILGSVTVHDSMCYGSDVQPVVSDEGDDGSRLCVSTSFYDKKVCLWRYAPNDV